MTSPLAFLEEFPPAEIARLIADQSDFMLTVLIANLPLSLQDAIAASFPQNRRAAILEKAGNVDISRVQTIVAGIAEKVRAKIAAEKFAAPNSSPANHQPPQNNYAPPPRAIGNAYAAASKNHQTAERTPNVPHLPKTPATKISLSPAAKPPVQNPAPVAGTNELRATLDRLSPKLRENLAANGVVPMPSPANVSPTGREFSPDPRAKLSRQLHDRQNLGNRERDSAAVKPIAPTASAGKNSWSARILTSVQAALSGKPPPVKNSRAATAPRKIPTAETPAFLPPPDTKQLLRAALTQVRIQAAKIEKRETPPLKIDGMALAASILREASPLVREHVCGAMPEIYDQLRVRMFVFADLEKSPQKTLSVVFSTVAPETAALALRFGSETLRARARHCLSSRRRQLIDDELARPIKGMRIADIEKAQQQIIDLAMELQHRGEIIIDANAADVV